MYNNAYTNHGFAGTEASFVTKFWTHLLLSLLIAFGVGTVGAMLHVMFFPFIGVIIIAEFTALITVVFLRKRKVASYALSYAFVVLSGLLVGVTVGAHAMMGVVGLSVAETAAIFIVLATIAIKTKTMFLKWGQALFAALLALIIVQILGLFFFHSTATQIAISAIGGVIFSCYILYDIQRVYNRGAHEESVPLMVLDVYLDILNLFLILLNLNSRKD